MAREAACLAGNRLRRPSRTECYPGSHGCAPAAPAMHPVKTGMISGTDCHPRHRRDRRQRNSSIWRMPHSMRAGEAASNRRSCHRSRTNRPQNSLGDNEETRANVTTPSARVVAFCLTPVEGFSRTNWFARNHAPVRP